MNLHQSVKEGRELPATRFVPCKHAVSKSSLPGLAYTFNPYVGCRHGCLYCYVPDVLRYGVSSPEWGREVAVKEGVLEKLAMDLKRLSPGVVGVSTATDPYQPLEKTLELTRTALKLFQSCGWPVSVQTKSALVRRDLDILKSGKFELGLTVTSMDDDFQRLFEPCASPPQERAETLMEASSLGIKTFLFFGPIIPGFNDSAENVRAIVSLAQSTGSSLLYDRINLKPLMLQRMRRYVSEDSIKSIKSYRFETIYQHIQKMCSEKRIQCRPAF